LTIGQAAERLNVSTKTIRRLIARGDLRAARIGRAIRLRDADIQRLMTMGSSR
jgi:excisionase family DNA binding protein